jgi:hypothetical protein
MRAPTFAHKHMPLAEYLHAVERSPKAQRLFHRAQRTLAKLERAGVQEKRAYLLAGVALADRRMIYLGKARRVALAKLARYLRTVTPNERAFIAGSLLVGCLPSAANEI